MIPVEIGLAAHFDDDGAVDSYPPFQNQLLGFAARSRARAR
jgi:hypothetical protein